MAKSAAKNTEEKKPDPVLTTILQIGDKQYDITDIANRTLKGYKSVHKRKGVTDFTVYIKPEENAVYYTVNGEGSDEFKVELK